MFSNNIIHIYDRTKQVFEIKLYNKKTQTDSNNKLKRDT